MSKPDFERTVREALKDHFGYVEPTMGRKVLRLVEDAYAAGLERAIELIPGGQICDPQDIADSIRAEKERV